MIKFYEITFYSSFNSIFYTSKEFQNELAFGFSILQTLLVICYGMSRSFCYAIT